MKTNFKYNLTGIIISVLITEIIFWILFLIGYFVVLQAIPGIRLANPELLWAMAAGPVVVVLFISILIWKNRSLQKFSENNLLQYLAPDISSVKATTKFILYRFALAFLAIALVNPRMGAKMAEATYSGIDIMIAVDVSSSMQAQDIKPNRLERAKRAMERLLDDLHGDRIGIIVFAGQSFVQLPMTTDYAAGKLFLNTIDTDIVPVQGTAIGSSIELAIERFDPESAANKAIIIITDGENHEDDAVAAATKAAELGIRVFTIGMGSENGAPIPEYQGNRQTGFKKDREGKTVISKLNEQSLKEIADAGNGSFIRATNAEVGLKNLLAELNKIERTEMGSVVYSDYEDRFQIFLGLALFCLVLEFLLTERSGFVRKWIKLFD